jgi:hypothetical protein
MDDAGSWFAPPDGQSSAAGAQALPFLGQGSECLGHLLAREMVNGGKLRLQSPQGAQDILAEEGGALPTSKQGHPEAQCVWL